MKKSAKKLSPKSLKKSQPKTTQKTKSQTVSPKASTKSNPIQTTASQSRTTKKPSPKKAKPSASLKKPLTKLSAGETKKKIAKPVALPSRAATKGQPVRPAPKKTEKTETQSEGRYYLERAGRVMTFEEGEKWKRENPVPDDYSPSFTSSVSTSSATDRPKSTEEYDRNSPRNT